MVIQSLSYMSEAAFEGFIRANPDAEYEYIGGKVVEVVSNPLSSKIAANILIEIGVYLRQHDIGHVTGADGGYVVGKGRYIPDVGFIRYTKQRELIYTEGYIPVAPDLAVEVISPANDDSEMAVKVADYLAAGTVVWLVKPAVREVQVFVPGESVLVLKADDTLTGGDVLPGFSLDVKRVFPQEAQS